MTINNTMTQCRGRNVDLNFSFDFDLLFSIEKKVDSGEIGRDCLPRDGVEKGNRCSRPGSKFNHLPPFGSL